MLMSDPGTILRLVRESAGLSLEALAQRVYFSKGYLANVETGKRKATPALIQAYQAALGDDVNRRQLLLSLLASATAPSASALEGVCKAFECALDDSVLTADDWLAKLEDYGHDYMLTGGAEMQGRLLADLVRLQTRLDDPVLAAVAAKLLTLQGLMIQKNTMPEADGRRAGAVRLYRLSASAADRSGDVGARVEVRGRAASGLASEGAELPVVVDLANQAMVLSDRPSLGRLKAQLALAHVHGLNGDRKGALSQLDDANRTLDAVNFDNRISAFANPEWLMASNVSLLASRVGEERIALKAWDTVERTCPPVMSRYSTHVELYRALLMAKCGGRKEGIDHARNTLANLPPERQLVSMRLRVQEIESA